MLNPRQVEALRQFRPGQEVVVSFYLDVSAGVRLRTARALGNPSAARVGT